MKYMCNHVLPVLSDLANIEEGMDSKLDMLKLLAEICENNGLSSDEVKEPLGHVYHRLIVSIMCTVVIGSGTDVAELTV